jgi:hypothetical protein
VQPIYFCKLKKNVSYFKIFINLRTYVTYNENIDSCNVLHKPFIRINQLFSSNMQGTALPWRTTDNIAGSSAVITLRFKKLIYGNLAVFADCSTYGMWYTEVFPALLLVVGQSSKRKSVNFSQLFNFSSCAQMFKMLLLKQCQCNYSVFFSVQNLILLCIIITLWQCFCGNMETWHCHVITIVWLENFFKHRLVHSVITRNLR